MATRITEENFAEHFRARLVRSSSGCLLWTGARSSAGYGQTLVPASWRTGVSEHMLTHRIAWILANGPIPRGLFVLHRCDVRACCNAEHLFLGDDAANSADKVAKGRHPHGERHYRARLSERDVAEIRSRAAAGEQQKDLASQFRVVPSHISRIVAGRRRIQAPA